MADQPPTPVQTPVSRLEAGTSTAEIRRQGLLTGCCGSSRKLIELANAFEPVQDGRIYIEKINGPFLFELKGTPAEYKAGLLRAIKKGWLELHESGTYVRFTETGAALFA